MIIKRIHLLSFGKFVDQEYDLAPGLNLIFGENEAGKSTIHTFIRGMLFGIEKQRGRGASKDTYSKYEPWENPGRYEGVMEVETERDTYLIERNFQKDHKSFRVTAQSDGHELSQEECGRFLDGLDEAAYYNTISIGQLESETDSQLASLLKNYAANLSSTKNMELDMTSALEDLGKQKRVLTRQYKDYNRQELYSEQSELNKQLNLVAQDQKEITKQQEELYQQKKREEKKLEELRQMEINQKQEEAKALTMIENFKEKNTSSRKNLGKVKLALSREQEKLTPLLNEMSRRKVTSLEDVDRLEEEESLMNVVNWPLFGLTIVSVVIFILSFFLGKNTPPIVQAGLVLLCIIFLTLFLLFLSRKKSQKDQNLRMLADLRETVKDVEKTEKRVAEGERRLAETQDAIKENDRGIEKLKAKLENQVDYQSKIQEVHEKIQAKDSNNQELVWKANKTREQEGEIQARQDEIQDLLKKIENADLLKDAYDLAMNKITELSSEIRGNFGRLLNDQASKYLKAITNGKYERLIIEEDLELWVLHRDRKIPVYQLSKGTIEQIYLALRLASAKMVFEDPKPILLDDTFMSYDNKRMITTLQFLNRLGVQVLIFTCHSREKLVLDKMQLPYHYINLSE